MELNTTKETEMNFTHLADAIALVASLPAYHPVAGRIDITSLSDAWLRGVLVGAREAYEAQA